MLYGQETFLHDHPGAPDLPAHSISKFPQNGYALFRAHGATTGYNYSGRYQVHSTAFIHHALKTLVNSLHSVILMFSLIISPDRVGSGVMAVMIPGRTVAVCGLE